MEKVRIGIIGSGSMGRQHSEAAQEVPQAELVAVAVGTRAPGLAKDFGIEYEKSVEDLVSRQDIDAVIITTPHAVHCEPTVLAVQHGKHVLVEKPMEISLEACDRMIEETQKAGINLMVGQTHRFNTSNIMAKELIEGGKIGKLLMGRDMLVSPGWQHGVSGWHADPKIGGQGWLIGYGVHSVDRMRWFFGSDVDQVFARFGPYPPDLPVESGGMLMMTFNSGAYATIWSAVSSPAEFQDTPFTAELMGEKGCLDVKPYKDVKVAYEGGEWETIYRSADHPGYILEGFARQLQEFVHSILEGRRPSVPGEEGRAAVEVCLAAYTSSDTGQFVRLPL